MENDREDLAISPNVSILVTALLKANPFHAKSLNRTLADLEPGEMQDIENHLVFFLNQGLSINFLAHCYETIMADVLRESLYFQKHKKYRYSSFMEVANSVYYNDDYMTAYMYGLLITLFFWPNHLRLFRFFQHSLPKDKQGTYLEIGPGHGYFLLKAMELSAFDNFVAIDLSETSIRLTESLAKTNRNGKSARLYCADFLTIPLEESSFDAIVMGEMLEHVENPRDFLQKIALISKSKAYIFLTTCVNAPATDHIYHFKGVEEIENMFSSCGLFVKDQCILPYVDKSLAECAELLLPVNVGFILEKK